MQDTLERERLIDNLIDIVFRQGERIARLEEMIRLATTEDVIVPEPATGGRWRLYVRDLGEPLGAVLVMKELL